MRGRSRPITAGPRSAGRRRYRSANSVTVARAPASQRVSTGAIQPELEAWAPAIAAVARNGATSTPAKTPEAGRVGRQAASVASGTRSQARQAICGPARRRSGRRRASSSRMAPALASAAESRVDSSSAPIVELLQQLAQFGDVLAAEGLAAREVRHHRRQAAIEEAVQQVPALARHPVLAADQRVVEVAAAGLLGPHRALAQQAVE